MIRINSDQITKEISIITPKRTTIEINNEPKKWNRNLFLLDSSYKFDVFQFIPRRFTITTKNGSSNFNKEMMMSFSQTISYKCKDPENNQFDLDIADEENVLDKFSQLFQGKTVSFTDEDLLISYKIVRSLNIQNCPDFMKPYELQSYTHRNSQETESEAVLDFTFFDEFLHEKFEQTFSIITKKREYKCNICAVYSSKVIREYLKKNEEANSYKYEIEDEFEEFENINKIFNFERVHISNDNAEILNTMIKELEIECLYEAIDEYQTKTEFNAEEEKLYEIDKINSLFQNINENNFQEIEEKIIKYAKNKEESEIQELCSYFIQHVKTENNHHKQELLSDLLIDLDKKSNIKEPLKLLLPQFIRQLLFILGITKSTCSFAYILYKKRMISKNELFQSFKHIHRDKQLKMKSYIHPYKMDKTDEINDKKSSNQKQQEDVDDIEPIIRTNINLWFLPEIIQVKSLNDFNFLKEYGLFTRNHDFHLGGPINLMKREKDENFEYLDSFLPDKLNVYEQIRDKGEPDDEITKALRNDDVDKLQQILTMSKIKHQEQATVPYNIFEEYIDNGNTNYINYSAAYGSIKCFKYLLLNHHNIDDKTFEYSIYGGNIEIIKIVDQQTNSLNKLYTNQTNELISLIIILIAKHRNDVFDWIINNVCFQKVTDKNTPIFKAILKFSAKNSNAHSLFSVLRKGYNMSSDFNNLVTYASANGFYKMIQLICLLAKKDFSYCSNIIPSFLSENVSIFKLYTKCNLGNDIYRLIIKYAISREFKSIIKYFFEKLSNKASDFRPEFLLKCLLSALDNKNDDEIFNILFNNFQNINSNLFDNQELIDEVLNKTILNKKIELAKEIIQLILLKNPKKDFSSAFAHSVAKNSIELCNYILDNKLFINYFNLAKYFGIIKNVNEETFSIFINNIPPSIKNLFNENNLDIAIRNKNFHLIKYLLNQNVKSEFALIDAVMSNDIEVVDLVLEHFDTNLINKSTKEGFTALSIAAFKSNFEIVDKLLSVEGIDASLANVHNQTALTIAIMNQDDRICTRILDFYGENLKDQVSQLNNSIKIFLTSYLRPNTLYYSNEKINPNMIPVLKRILEVENVDLNCCEGDYSVLSFASKINDRSLVEYLLKTNKVKLNQRDPNLGNTALIVSILNENYDIAKVLISEDNIELNMSNYENETALTISVEKEREDIINMIINNNKFEPTKSRLNYAFYISTPKISKLLISTKTLDVNYLNKISKDSSIFGYNKSFISNYKNNDNKNNNNDDDDIKFRIKTSSKNQSKSISNIYTTKIINIASSNKEEENDDDEETIDLIIQHPTFDKEKSLCKLALFKSIENKNRFNVFKKLFTLCDEDVNIRDENGTSLLVAASMNNNDKIVEFILNDRKFDCNKNMIVYAYFKSLNFVLSDKIEKYMNEHSKSIDFDCMFPDGSTIFTAIIEDNKRPRIGTNSSSSSFIATKAKDAIKFLCEIGADPNKPNKEGKYPLEIAMNNDVNSMNDITIELLNSNKIDFNEKINYTGSYVKKKYEYYVHIAASKKSSHHLENILKNKSVDINATDSNGDTPLMISCKSKLADNIKLLFTRDDLDFLHRNNEGKDALMLMKGNNESTQNKEEYLNKLLKCCERPNRTSNLGSPNGGTKLGSISQNIPKKSNFKLNIFRNNK